MEQLAHQYLELSIKFISFHVIRWYVEIDPVGQHQFFGVEKLVIGKVGYDVLLGICHVAKKLLEKDVKFAFVLQQIHTLFSCVDGGNVRAKSKQRKTRIV